MAIMEFWGDGSGAAKALTTSFVSGPVVRIADPADLFLRADVAVLAATRIEFQAQFRPIGGGAGDWITLPVERVDPDYVTYSAAIAAIDGALATDVPLFFHVPGECDLRIQARRVDGGATTTLYVDGEYRYNRDSPTYMDGGGAGSGSSSSTVIDRAYDSVEDAYRVGEVTPPQADRDASPQVIVDATDVAAAANYPSDSGLPIGDRAWLAMALQIKDGAVTIEVSDDQLLWTDVTKRVVDEAQNAGGYASFSEPGVAIVQFALEWDSCPHGYIRWKWTPANATNEVKILCTQRAST